MKPAYKVPSMAEIEALPWNGYTVASTFSGAGGSCLGYRMAGYKVAYANEFIPAAQETYIANNPNSYLDTRDIRTVSGAEILEHAKVGKGELDILDGSPPCAAFSMNTSNKKTEKWGHSKKYSDTTQVVDDLFFEYARLVGEIQPKVFVAENVPGLVRGKAQGYYFRIFKALQDQGYKVKTAVLNAQWLGVPQARRRVIFIGVRNDLNLEPTYPTPLSYYYNLEEAFKDIPVAKVKEEQGRELTKGTQQNDLWHLTAAGSGFDSVTSKLNDGSKRYLNFKQKEYALLFNLRKLHPQKPANTILQGSTLTYRWDIPRTLSIPELRRISSFPDDFVLTGKFEKRWERIGRAVPPVMMKHVAETIAEKILKCAD